MRFLKLRNNGQIAPFMALVIVIIILAIGATVLIGELAYERVRLSNATDAAVISAGSEVARSLNLIRKIHYQMLINYIQAQAKLLGVGVVIPTNKSQVMVVGDAAFTANAENSLLYQNASDAGYEATKRARAGLYERLLGGFIDEPKPFRYKEVDGKKVLDYDDYLNKDTPFVGRFREAKKGDGERWYKNNMISYSWNRGAVCTERDEQGRCVKKEFIDGTLNFGAPVGDKNGVPYAAHLQVELTDTVGAINVKPQFMLLFFLWQCGESVCPGFVPLPMAWIRKIDISPRQISAKVTKLPFRTFPYFFSDKEEGREEGEKEKEISHRSALGITGALWRGYGIKMKRLEK